MKNNKLMTAHFKGTKNLARLVAVFLIFFAFKAEAQNNALNFNGYNDSNLSGVQNKVVCGNSIGNFGTSNFTIEFNIKTTSTDSNAEWLLTKRSVCGHASFFNIGITNGIVYLEIDQDNNGTNHNDLVSNTTVNDGLWHHVALVRSGTSLNFYIDGIASGSKTDSFITNVSNSDNLTIGGFGSNCSTNQNFVGSLDELRIWNLARTQSQIQAAKNTELAGTETGLITYFNFNQGTANASNTSITTLLDKSANANNGTLSNFNRTGTTSNWVGGNSAVTSASTINNALNFNGYNDSNLSGVQNKVVCGNSIGNFGTSNFTIEFNIKTTSTDSNAEWLLTKRSVCGHASFFNIGITNGIVYLEIDQDNNGTNHNDLVSSTAVNDGTWHHVALVRSGTSLNFYIDGLASGSKTDSFITNVSNSDNLTIGGFGSNCSTNQNFVGSLDELRIWNLARTQSQIQAAKNTELAGTETGLITYFNFNQGTANATNIGVTTLIDLTSNHNDGTLNNFSLIGANSNWVSKSINTSNTTQVRASQCGVTLAALNSAIAADVIPTAQMYRFEVSNGANVRTYETTKYNFDLTKIAGSTYGTTYSIKVAVKINNVWGAYGTACNVTTPTIASANNIPITSMRASQCGSTLATIGSPIHSELVYAAEAYRFQLTNGATVNVVESPIYYFFLTNTAFGTYGTTFSVKTAAKINGIWGNYGAACSISTPALTPSSVPTTQLMSTFCNTTLAALNTKIAANTVYNADGYRFKIVKAGVETIYVSSVYNFKLSDAGIVATNGTTYAISVAARVNGTFGNYGASCNVTTPGNASNSRQITENSEFSLVAYPNPSNSVFKLQINGANNETVSLLVFDMMGRQIENKVVNASDVENISLGQNYSTGVYNVIVSQGMNTKTVRLVKK